MSTFAQICQQAARAGGETVLAWRGRFEVRHKGPADLVTQADLASQETIRSIIHKSFPDHEFRGEEDEGSGESPGKTLQGTSRLAEFVWLVDPLDGTTNYVHGVPHYAVSVAVVRRTPENAENHQILAGCIFDPVSGECFWSAAGEGAWLGEKRLKTSGASHLGDALVACSVPAEIGPGDAPMTRLVRVAGRCQAFRRGGSSALALAYIAAGRFDAYWASDVKPWDVAAGVLMIAEAGGSVAALDGGPFDLWDPNLVAAATDPLGEELRRAFGGSGDGVD